MVLFRTARARGVVVGGAVQDVFEIWLAIAARVEGGIFFQTGVEALVEVPVGGVDGDVAGVVAVCC